MNETTPTKSRSTAKLHWSGGMWFGSIVGGTCWMLGISIQFIIHGQHALAIAPAVAFVIINATATMLWQRRHQSDCSHSYLIVVSLISIAVPITLVPITYIGTSDVLMAMNWPPPPFWHAVTYLLAPVAMLVLYFTRSPIACGGLPIVPDKSTPSACGFESSKKGTENKDQQT